MADESTSYSDLISRRRFVELTGVTGAAALAGCDGDGDGTDTSGNGNGTDNGTDNGTESGQDYPDTRHTGVTATNPANIQYNPVNSTSQPAVSDRIIFERLGQYNYEEGEYQSAGLSEWNFTGDTFEMTIRDGLEWTNGDEVTAGDLVTQFRIMEYDGDAVYNWADSVEAPDGEDGKTVVLNIADSVNPGLVETDVLTKFIKMDQATYGSYLEDLEAGDTEVAAVRDHADTDPVSNGPFQIEEKTEQILLLSRRDGGNPDLENINFGEYAFNFNGDNASRRQELLSLAVDSDYSVTTQSRLVADFPDAVEEVMTPDVFGVAINPNHNHEFGGDRAVRQAIAYLINRDLGVENSYPRVKKAPEVMTPIATDYQETWLGDEMGNYETYGQGESLTSEAESVLQDAGYEQVDGSWQNADGNVVTVPITSPSGWGDWNNPLQGMVQTLNDFGFAASFEGTGSYFEDIANPDSFAFIANTWLHGGPTPYPYYSLLHSMHQPQQHHVTNNYPANAEQYGGSSADIEVPARDGSGTMTINPGDQLDELAATSDEDAATEIVRDLAWAANHDLPMIPLMEKDLQQWVTSDEWNVPTPTNDATEAQVEWVPTWLPRQGSMNYTG